jgi:hypothetical protein
MEGEKYSRTGISRDEEEENRRIKEKNRGKE